MVKNPRSLVSVVSLIKAASRYTAGALPCNFQSYPIPCPGIEGLRVAFLYTLAQIVEPQKGMCIKPPRYITFFNAHSGRFEELKYFEPQAYGLPPVADEWLGRCLTPAERMAPEFLTLQIKLYQALDDLLGPFASGVRPSDADLAGAATVYKQLFAQVAEQPLMPFYLKIGEQFFGWLSQIAT